MVSVVSESEVMFMFVTLDGELLQEIFGKGKICCEVGEVEKDSKRELEEYF